MFLINDELNISKINTVVFYNDRNDPFYSWDGNPSTYELLYYTKGDVVLTFNKKIYNIKAGDFLYLPKGVVGAEYTVKVTEEFSFYGIYFDTEDSLPKTPIHISSCPFELQKLYEKLYAEWSAKRYGYYLRTMSGIYELINLISSHKFKNITNYKFSYLAPSEEYMSLHYHDKNFNYKTFVALSNLSYTYFKKLFIDKYGMPPVKYITHLKINYACELLRANILNISEVAEMCGYENASYFSKTFKNLIGVSPSKYTNISKNNQYLLSD